jgi:hypothetical protein
MFGKDHFDLVEMLLYKAEIHHIRSTEESPGVHARDVAVRLNLTEVVDAIDKIVGKKKEKEKKQVVPVDRTKTSPTKIAGMEFD